MSTRLSQGLATIEDLGRDEKVSVGRILDTLSAGSHALLCLVLCLPFLQPVPIAGLSTVFGVVIMMIGFCIASRLPPWLPEMLRAREVPGQTLVRIARVGQDVMHRVGRFIRPRGQWINAHPWLRVAHGFVVATCGFLLALPFPIPLTNMLPALAACTIAVGMLEDDGFFVVFGYLAFIVSLLYFAALVVLPILGYQMLR